MKNKSLSTTNVRLARNRKTPSPMGRVWQWLRRRTPSPRSHNTSPVDESFVPVPPPRIGVAAINSDQTELQPAQECLYPFDPCGALHEEQVDWAHETGFVNPSYKGFNQAKSGHLLELLELQRNSTMTLEQGLERLEKILPTVEKPITCEHDYVCLLEDVASSARP